VSGEMNSCCFRGVLSVNLFAIMHCILVFPYKLDIHLLLIIVRLLTTAMTVVIDAEEDTQSMRRHNSQRQHADVINQTIRWEGLVF
jgi:hypothetical protein